MTGAEIRSIITKNWDDVGCTLEKEGLRVQPEQFSGWRIALFQHILTENHGLKGKISLSKNVKVCKLNG
ncbi:MAG: hypothetical protein VSS75_015120 [Candidatus Parabeggiatoa sp.]|nr:hypothetical protein [Candidatus Parabeggiatoa sp.]